MSEAPAPSLAPPELTEGWLAAREAIYCELPCKQSRFPQLLLQLLDPTTSEGRQRLSVLTKAEVAQLRASYPVSLRQQALLLGVEGAPLLVAVALALQSPWGLSVPLAALLGLLGAAGALVFWGTVWMPMLRLTTGVGGIWARDQLQRKLSPISRRPLDCRWLLKTLEAPAATAYRDTVVARRELLEWDSQALRMLHREHLEQQARWEAESSYRKLMGLRD